MYKVEMVLENMMSRALFIVALLFNLVAISYGQVALNTVDSARMQFRRYCESFISEQSLRKDGGIEKALWLVSAFNQSGRDVDKFLHNLSLKYDSLSARQKYEFVSLLSSRDSEGIYTDILKKALNDADSKLSLLAYSKLVSDSNFYYDRNYPREWNDIKDAIYRKDYSIELSSEHVDDLLTFIKSELSGRFNILVLARADRNCPVKLILVYPDGRLSESFVYLARAANNTLPYFTNGNTPCGVYKITGKTISDNVYIGPVRALQTELPFESDCIAWGIDSGKWTEDMYMKMFPVSLSNNYMLRQAFYAGAVGRSEIIVHGSTIDPYFFASEDFFPLTPSLGCLSAFEIWNAIDGHLIESHQKRMIDKLPDNDEQMGFMYVLQVDSDTYYRY